MRAILPGALMLFVASGVGCSDKSGPNPPPHDVASITVSLDSALLLPGQTAHASAVLRDAGGGVVDGTVSWSSSAASIATVNPTTGVVTGVSVGHAEIIASSGGVTGTAIVTVIETVAAIRSLTVLDGSGHAANLSNVGGTIGLEMIVDMPTPTGTLVVKIDTAEFARQAITAPQVNGRVGGGNGGGIPSPALQTPAAPPVGVGVHVNLNTASTVYTISGAEISATPLARNGQHILNIALLAPGPTVAVSADIPVTLQNPDGFTGRVTSQRVTTLDGTAWSSGDLTMQLVPIQFGSLPASSATLKLADAKPDFGFGALTNVLDLITRSAPGVSTSFALPASSFVYESSPGAGTQWYLDSYSFGSTQYSPRSAEPNIGGHCLYTGGTGFIRSTGAQLPPVPTYCTDWVQVDPLPGTLLGEPHHDIGLTFHHDSKPPVVGAGAFTLVPRLAIPNQNAYGPTGTFGVSGNWIGRDYQFGLGLDAGKIADAGSGFDALQRYAYHVGSTPDFVPSGSTLVADVNLVPETGANRTLYGAMVLTDRVGNSTVARLTTNATNPYTTGGGQSTGYGIDPALLGVTRNVGLVNYSGPANGYLIRGPTLTGVPDWGFNLTGSPSGYEPNGSAWARIYRDGDPTRPVVGGGTMTTIPWFVNGSGGASMSAALPFSQVTARSTTLYGGTGEGAYTGYFGAVDRAGNVTPESGPVHVVWDYTAPTTPAIAAVGSLNPGDSGTITVTGSDNVGLDYLDIGPVFNVPSPLFEGGYAYALPGHIPLSGGLGHELKTTFNLPIRSQVPKGMVFFDGTTGVLQSTVNNVIGAAARVQDLAGNQSPLRLFMYANSNSYPVPMHPANIHVSPSSMTACNGATCSNGALAGMLVDLYYDGPDSGDPLNKFELYALTADGRSSLLGAFGPRTSSPLGGGLARYSAQFSYDWSTFCGSVGAMNLYALGQSRDRNFWYKTNPFFAFTLYAAVVQSTYCQIFRFRP